MRWVVKAVLVALSVLALVSPAMAQRDVLDRALADAAATAREASGRLAPTEFGVDTAAYLQALEQRLFTRPDGQAVPVRFVIEESAAGSCEKFAAYVVPVANDPSKYVFICPQFFTPGADRLRETTLLHELVHVVAGRDECQAMAFTARLQFLASGSFQPVAQYWAASKCANSRYRLPN